MATPEGFSVNRILNVVVSLTPEGSTAAANLRSGVGGGKVTVKSTVGPSGAGNAL